jgi:hypothetical protein
MDYRVGGMHERTTGSYVLFQVSSLICYDGLSVNLN